MSNRYEQSLKEQAARIRRELAGEKETTPVERPKKEEREDRFVLTDVPSPIYGFQRPKKQRSIQEDVTSIESEMDVSSESEEGKTDEALENMTDETIEASGIETMEQTDLTEVDAGLVPVTDSELLNPDPSIESSTEAFAVESFDSALTEQEPVEEEPVTELKQQDESLEVTSLSEDTEQPPVENGDEISSENTVEHVLETETVQEQHVFTEKRAEEKTQVQSSAVKKPVGPPVNVVMTTKDLMAMYRARREQNNLHGKK
ncbi:MULTISPECIES: hypothetical protein [unclassified Exiguobacterium]|uniref:hypothetical protein n=1 Tax=unclassified Exiguobacterium TaxID=2644629 RepID=UPI000B59305A|nr:MULTISPECIES: hypothetical protein [unclassified Exiguobacterium]ASI36094.1 hypothetical protein A0126_11070 [Exiguobacterium sp. N4-1P]